MKIKSVLVLVLLVFMVSCVPQKDVIYFQGIDQSQSNNNSNYEPVIKADDVLYINVSTFEPKASAPFNIGIGTEGISSGLQLQRNTYLVDSEGFIQFPVFGSIKVAGLTKLQTIELLKSKIVTLAKDPVINLRIMNYKITILGEVSSPGSYTIQSDRITIPEALALAGDMTLFGKRENILILREDQGVKTSVRVDMTDPAIINSPYYYLTQNDVLYIEPNKRRINSTAIGPNILAGISILGFAITTILLLTK